MWKLATRQQLSEMLKPEDSSGWGLVAGVIQAVEEERADLHLPPLDEVRSVTLRPEIAQALEPGQAVLAWVQQEHCTLVAWSDARPDDQSGVALSLPGGLMLRCSDDGIQLVDTDGTSVRLSREDEQVQLTTPRSIDVSSSEGDVRIAAPAGKLQLQARQTEILGGEGGMRLKSDDQLIVESASSLTLSSEADILALAGDTIELYGRSALRAGSIRGEATLQAGGDLRLCGQARTLIHSKDHAILQSAEGELRLQSKQEATLFAEDGQARIIGRLVQLN